MTTKEVIKRADALRMNTVSDEQKAAWSTNTASIISTSRTETSIYASAPERQQAVQSCFSTCRMN